LDELQQLKNELWKIILNSKSENSVKITTVRELHNPVKKVLILRDLPFITRISKHYDITMLENSLSGSKSSSTSTTFRDNKSSENQFDNVDVIKNSHLTDTINSHNNYDDDVMTLMQAQIPKQDTLDGKNSEVMTNEKDLNNLISPDHWETIRKLRGLRD
jgi:hypothetical protein